MLKTRHDQLVVPVDPTRDHILGAVDAELTLVEYGSYACSYCHAAHKVVARLRDQFGERLTYVYRHLPLADEIVLQARQELVNRLDGYQVEHPETFQAVVAFIHDRMMPIVKRYAVSGRAMVNTEEPLFRDPVAVAMLIDVFSERGFRANVDIHRIEIPERFDLATGKIETREKRVFRITILFTGSKIRRG